jgi:hypothetical protein
MIRADVHMPYFRKFLWIAAGCVVGVAWCSYDAWVTYPRKLEIAEAFESFPETEEGQQQWAQRAEESGWSQAAPSKSTAEIESLIFTQHLMIVGFVAVGCIMFLKWFMARGSWIEGDETEFKNSKGRHVALDDLVSIDRRKWEENGIAVLRFKSGGRSGKFVLDDFKYDEHATGRLLEIAEERLAEQQSENFVKDPHQARTDP